MESGPTRGAEILVGFGVEVKVIGDDSACPLPSMRKHLAGQLRNAREVHIHRARQIIVADLFECADIGGSGIVDQHINRSMFGHDIGNYLLDR